MASIIHLGETLPPFPQNNLSDVGCVVFSVAVDVLCHVAVCVSPPPFSSGLGPAMAELFYPHFKVALELYCIKRARI